MSGYAVVGVAAETKGCERDRAEFFAATALDANLELRPERREHIDSQDRHRVPKLEQRSQYGCRLDVAGPGLPAADNVRGGGRPRSRRWRL